MPKKKTHEEFLSELYNAVGDEYKVLGTYVNKRTKIDIEHVPCGYIWNTYPLGIINENTRCPECLNKGKTKSHDEFINEVKELVNEEFTVLNVYKNATTKVKFTHNICKCEFDRLPNNFIKNPTCPACTLKRMTKTHDTFIKEINEVINGEYEVLSQYVNSSTKVKLKHLECGYIYMVLPNEIKRGARCPNCLHRNRTTTSIKKEIYDVVGKEYQLTSEYIATHKEISMKHLVCGKTFYTTPSRFLNANQRCPHCFGNTKKNTEQFKQEVFDLVEDEYTVLEEYINTKTKVLMKHNECGNEYSVTPTHFLSGNRCPKCNSSKGEKKILQLLNSYKTSFTTQYRFEDCKDKKALPFDFAVFNDKNELILLIEYDGEQHFKPVDFRNEGKEHAEKQFIRAKKRDQIKNDYCKENAIPLLRIPYWDFDNIEQILERELGKVRTSSNT